MLKKIRTTVAVIVFALITLLFLDFTGTIHAYFGWLAKIQFLPAFLAMNIGIVIGLILLTFIFGRLYCSVICPLGIMQDIFGRFGRIGKKKKYRYTFSKNHAILRVILLIAFSIALAIPGISAIAHLIAPYSAFGRIAANLLAPVYALGNNCLAYFAERADSYMFYHVDVWMKSAFSFIVAALTLIVLAVLAWRNGRTWCNNICPIGTILGYISKYSIFKPHIDTEKCKNCGLCTRSCKAACIDSENHTIDYSRCVDCFNCIDTCKHGAISYCRRTISQSASNGEPDKSKRAFLTTSALFLAGATVKAQEKKVDGGLAMIQDKQIPNRRIPPKPAGAQSLKHFTNSCTACQLCVSVCPNNVLRPSSDISSLMQPEMQFTDGYCRPECTRCSEVCPTGAIMKITPAEKSSTQIGHAVWIMHNCIVETDGVQCGNCARHCPVGAISLVSSQSNPNLKIPAVNAERCIGCGECEYICPARPFSAIYVEGNEVQREI